MNRDAHYQFYNSLSSGISSALVYEHRTQMQSATAAKVSSCSFMIHGGHLIFFGVPKGLPGASMVSWPLHTGTSIPLHPPLGAPKASSWLSGWPPLSPVSHSMSTKLLQSPRPTSTSPQWV